MKMLFNNRGISLVVLIVAMTLIAILGTSFVSLMGSKQKGFLHQIDSYRALNIANAGVEYAIRIVNDNITSPEGYIAQCPSWTTHNFVNGQFRFCYVSNLSDPEFNNLRVEGIYDGGSPTHTAKATRIVGITHFMNYASPSGVNRIPHNLQSVAGNVLTIPIINSSGANIEIGRVGIIVSSSGQLLRQIDFNTTTVFNYTLSMETGYPPHDSCGVPPCVNPLPSGSEVGFTFNSPVTPVSHTLLANTVYQFLLYFGGAPVGQYDIRFYGSDLTTLLGTIYVR